MIYFISDYHFFHQNIFKYEPIRQQFGDQFIKEMIKRYNSVVAENDTIYFVGDIFCGFNQARKKFNLKRSEKEYAKVIMDRLPGKKILIKGNHDHKSNEWYRDIGFNEIKWIDEVEEFLVFHYPICNKYIDEIALQFGNEFAKIIKDILKKKNEYDIPVIHGHIHSNQLLDCPNHFNVSCEVIDFTPISIEEIRKRT